jgi:hypothetical protein
MGTNINAFRSPHLCGMLLSPLSFLARSATVPEVVCSRPLLSPKGIYVAPMRRTSTCQRSRTRYGRAARFLWQLCGNWLLDHARSLRLPHAHSTSGSRPPRHCPARPQPVDAAPGPPEECQWDSSVAHPQSSTPRTRGVGSSLTPARRSCANRVAAPTGIACLRHKRAPASPPSAHPMGSPASRRRLVRRAEGSVSSGSRSVKIFRAQSGF